MKKNREINKMNNEKKIEIFKKLFDKKQENKGKVPYMTKDIYKNYAKGMKERNQKRKDQGLKVIYIRTFEEWSNV